MALLTHNGYDINVTHLKYTVQWFFSSVFTELCKESHNLILEYFYHPWKKFLTHWQSLPISPFFQPLAAANLLSVPLDLSVPANSYKWNDGISGLLWLASLNT